MTARLYLVPAVSSADDIDADVFRGAEDASGAQGVGVSDVVRLLGQLAGPGSRARAELAARAAARPVGAVESLRLVR